jgi:glutamine---fructose-6-phosphate transaminase (isomerizing)
VRPGPTLEPLIELLERLRDELEAAIAVVSDQPEALALARWPFRLASGTPEWLGPIVSIVVGQLHALHLTHARGLDPEEPRNLRKVTRTR